MRVLSVGSLPPGWGGPTHGGVATLHATLLEGFADPRWPVEVVGVVPPAPVERELSVPVFARPPSEPIAAFYQRLLEQLEPDVVVMHHFAHTIGVTHARMTDPPPAIGIAHSWHNVTFSSGEARARARETTAEALGGLRALVGMSNHCLREGEELGFRYPEIVETIYHPLQALYSSVDVDHRLAAQERHGVAYLGSLIPRKRPMTLVEAAAKLPDVEVAIAGRGELEGELRAQIAALSLGERVHVCDLDDLHVRDLLLRSKLMCLPSRSETFGLAYTEALACGTPVVGFAPTLREIRDEVGIDIGEPLTKGGADEVAAAIERVGEAAWDRAELRRRTVNAFGLTAATERYVGLIGRIVGESRSGAGREARPAPDRRPALRASTAICVLGMSRTGTSLTTRLLGLAGVYLGPEDELLGGDLRHLAGEGDAVRRRAKEANPEGFWEHYRLMRLNERILKALGGSWREPPPLPPGWELSERLSDERDEARLLLAESFDGHDLWAWKDPRNSLTLPFWQRLLPDLRYVVCLRSPLDVASSLQRRDGIALEGGVGLWMTYLASALLNTSGRPRLFVAYESYFGDSVGGVVAALARFAGRETAFEGADGRRRLSEAIDERLWRNRSAAAGPAQSVSGQAAALYRIVAALAAAASGAEPRSDAEIAELSSAADRQAEEILGRLARSI